LIACAAASSLRGSDGGRPRRLRCWSGRKEYAAQIAFRTGNRQEHLYTLDPTDCQTKRKKKMMMIYCCLTVVAVPVAVAVVAAVVA
jgi:hypothetical protein